MQPRKSKALIITFIVVLALLVGGYFLVTKGGILKGDSTLGKKFAPLLGTPKQKDVIVGTENTGGGTTTTGDTNSTPTTTPSTTTGSTTGSGNTGDQSPTGSGASGGPDPIPKYVPPNLSFPQPDSAKITARNYTFTTECSDGKDNDKDGSADSADDDCHTDSNSKNLLSYVATYNTEAGSRNTPQAATPNDPTKNKALACTVADIPLVFTAEEQARLDELTRQFYRLAPQLKSANDIVAEINAEKGYRDIIANAEDLTAQCKVQTSTPRYLKNNIDQEVLAPGTKTLFTKWVIDDSASSQPSVGYISVAERASQLEARDCYNNGSTYTQQQACRAKNLPLVHALYYHQQSDSYPTQSTLISVTNKGRTERLPNPYYDSSKEVYPFKATESYFLQYFPDPRDATGKTLIWDWNQKEKDWGVW